jgi:hypothetical protein
MRARVPQHLELDDVVAWGLGASDLVCVAVAVAAAWWTWSAVAAPVLRFALAAPLLVVGLALALLKVADRDLRSWTLVVARFASRPRQLRSRTARCD